ncbi:MAG: hypothetical protein H6858_04575 [Rhodospirillales bacterium]|nr:hypothetical protein [Alphaproteobacteria bacterium]MCB1840287.1 hypothetical protein [Alphaproteobacteria bacterium]MCB9976860.1 hypothetical protein [Rhodospirillales bacterium]
MKRALTVLTLVIGMGTLALPAQAQMNNKPFSFNTPDGGVGMSVGAKQAIINQQVYDSTPKNMLRNAEGQLLSVTKGENNYPIVTNADGTAVIPNYRGTSYKGSNLEMSVGVFNSFFSPRNSNDSPVYLSASNGQTGPVISTWTARVASGEPVSFVANNSIDTWTGLVETLGY